MYERVVHDLGETCLKFDRWWITAAQKYGLEGRHEIDFGTGALLKV